MTLRRDPLDPAFFALLSSSYERLTGRSLTPEGTDAQWLYGEAPFGLLAHSNESEPRFTYANIYAQERFEYSWDDFVGLASELSAAPEAREDRQALLDEVEQHGYVTGYRGRRKSRSGRLFWIADVTMWNLSTEDGVLTGQAALFSDDSVSLTDMVRQ